MKYQEKVSTRGDVRSLYVRVKEQPAISHYRGYTATKSYGWDEEADDYIKADGEKWFENPCYDPDFFTTNNEEQPMNEPNTEDVMRELEYHADEWDVLRDALALLREKDAEIEKWETAFENEYNRVEHLMIKLENARAEAITELLERAKAMEREMGDLKPFITIEDLEEIAKAMKGE